MIRFGLQSVLCIADTPGTRAFLCSLPAAPAQQQCYGAMDFRDALESSRCAWHSSHIDDCNGAGLFNPH